MGCIDIQYTVPPGVLTSAVPPGLTVDTVKVLLDGVVSTHASRLAAIPVEPVINRTICPTDRPCGLVVVINVPVAGIVPSKLVLLWRWSV